MKPDRTELTVEYVPVGEIQPHPANARQGDVGAIHQSIETNGVYRPLIVQKGTGFILAGNHTYRAMAQQGAVVVPVVWRDVDDETARRIMLADNRTADLGDYDNQALLDLLQGLPDLVGTGYDDDDLDAITHLLDGPTSLDDLQAEFGDFTDDDLLKTISMKVPPHLFAQWADHRAGFDNDADALEALLDA